MNSNKNMVNKAKLYRLQKWSDEGNRNSDDYDEYMIRKFCRHFGLDSSVFDYIVDLFGRVRDGGLLRGRSLEVGVGACCLLGCRLLGEAYNVNDVVEVFHIDKKSVNGMHRVVKRELGLSVPVLSPCSYVPRFCRDLDLEDDVCSRAMDLVGLGDSGGLVNGKSPLGLVGASLYLACRDCGVSVTQRDVCGVVGVSEVVLRSRCYELDGLM